MGKNDEERYQNYLRYRNENDALRIQEQGRMDNIIFTSDLVLICISFAFMGIIFDKHITSLSCFVLSVACACLSILSNYYSYWCSIKDIVKSNDILDDKYKNGQDVNEEIVTNYLKWIGRLNNMAIIFLILGAVFFFGFVYANIN